MRNEHSQLPDDLRGVAEQLEDHRPEPDPAVLDRVKRQALTRAGRGRRVQTGGFMKSRIAIALMLTAGLITSGGGAALAVSGISSGDNAAVSQYLRDTTGQDQVPTSGSAPTEEQGAEEDQLGGVAGETDDPVQQARQSGGDGGRQSLPFTGLAAVPLLLVGLALTGGGLVMRRRAKDHPGA